MRKGTISAVVNRRIRLGRCGSGLCSLREFDGRKSADQNDFLANKLFMFMFTYK
jgi:hypothetical protein